MSTANIDLYELSRRESERIEWKRNVADPNDVIRCAAAFANDFLNLGGGYIVCGAEESRDAAGFQTVSLEGLTADRLREIEGKVLSGCREQVHPPVVPLTQEIATSDLSRRVLVFVVPATGHAHTFRASQADGTKYYIRVGRETREARDGLLRELLTRKNAIEPWDRRLNASARCTDVDLLILREYLQTMSLWDPNRAIEDYLSPTQPVSAFVPPLVGKLPMASELVPRNFTLMMFSSQPTKFAPGAFCILSIYPGTDRSESVAERTEITGSIVEQAKRIIERLNVESGILFDKTSANPNQPKYPRRAIQEAVVNALVHRDYETDQPTRVTVFADRIEICSPGTLPRAVDVDRFRAGTASSFWRNQSFAFFFAKLQLAQAEGQGIPTIIRTMREEGCPNPVFDVGTEHVTCTLPAHPRHKIIRRLRDIENDIILGNRQQALTNVESVLQEDPQNFRALDLFCEVCNLLKVPERVFELVNTNRVSLDQVNPATLLVMAESLLTIPANGRARELAQQMLSRASVGRMEAVEARRIANGMRKLGEDEKAVKFIDDAMAQNPLLRSNAPLLGTRAEATIDLAKRCIETARDYRSSPRIKGRAWDQCRQYLERAEQDLLTALDNAGGSIEEGIIQRDLQFLERLKTQARRPAQRGRGHWRGRRQL